MKNDKKVKIIYNDKNKKDEDFYEKFIKHLTDGKTFKLENCTIEGNISIEDIYNRIKDNKKLKELIKEDNLIESMVITNTITLNIKINLSFHNVKFDNDIQMFHNKAKITKLIEKTYIRVAFESIFFIKSQFKGKVDFRNSVFNGEVNFIDSTFEEDVNFWKSTFREEVHFQKTKSNDNLIIKGMLILIIPFLKRMFIASL